MVTGVVTSAVISVAANVRSTVTAIATSYEGSDDRTAHNSTQDLASTPDDDDYECSETLTIRESVHDKAVFPILQIFFDNANHVDIFQLKILLLRRIKKQEGRKSDTARESARLRSESKIEQKETTEWHGIYSSFPNRGLKYPQPLPRERDVSRNLASLHQQPMGGTSLPNDKNNDGESHARKEAPLNEIAQAAAFETIVGVLYKHVNLMDGFKVFLLEEQKVAFDKHVLKA